MMNNKRLINSYYCKRTACFVLSSLMKSPSLIQGNGYQLDMDDFIGVAHRILFGAIHNLAKQGAKDIGLPDIETYLNRTDSVAHKRLFEDENGVELIGKLLEYENGDNFEYYYTVLVKYTQMREYLKQGIDVTCLLDLNEIDPNLLAQQQERYDSMSLQELISYFDTKYLKSKVQRNIGDFDDCGVIGDTVDDVFKQLEEAEPFGFATESEFLNSIIHGFFPSRLYLTAASSGSGKSRAMAIRLLMASALEIYNTKTKKWQPNPHGEVIPTLLIQTELTMGEIITMCVAFIARVDENKIKYHRETLTSDEVARIERAKEVLKASPLYIETNPDYDVAYLWTTIERHRIEHDIRIVCLDYIESTSALMSEYARNSKVSPREDSCLLNLSANLKNMARKFDLAIMTATQTTSEALRDITARNDAGCIRGARALANKVDCAMSLFPVHKKELELVAPIIDRIGFGGKMPNTVITIFKNRNSKHNAIKIFAHINLGTMEVKDMFVTDLNYEPLDIEKTEIRL